MIEKLKTPKHISWDDSPEGLIQRHRIISDVYEKVNQLVDAVNYHQKWLSEIQCHIDTQPAENSTNSKMENVDPYAEQRKWIGCLVEYGNADDGFRYGILTNIEPRYSAYPFEIDNGRDATADCWLPSKTIFYKGGDNE